MLGLHGTISQRVGLMTGSGGTSTDEFGREFDQALADPEVKAILTDVDSPGGSVFGVHELSQKIYESRGKKPIVAIANSEAYSAAYYVASAADELWVTPTGMVGSIGVLSMHVDWSKSNEQQGIGVTYIHAGKYKVEETRTGRSTRRPAPRCSGTWIGTTGCSRSRWHETGGRRRSGWRWSLDRDGSWERRMHCAVKCCTAWGRWRRRCMTFAREHRDRTEWNTPASGLNALSLGTAGTNPRFRPKSPPHFKGSLDCGADRAT